MLFRQYVGKTVTRVVVELKSFTEPHASFLKSAHLTHELYIQLRTYGSKTKRAVAICVHSLLGAGTRNKQVKSTEVGQEGGTNQAKW